MPFWFAIKKANNSVVVSDREGGLREGKQLAHDKGACMEASRASPEPTPGSRFQALCPSSGLLGLRECLGRDQFFCPKCRDAGGMRGGHASAAHGDKATAECRRPYVNSGSGECRALVGNGAMMYGGLPFLPKPTAAIERMDSAAAGGATVIEKSGRSLSFPAAAVKMALLKTTPWPLAAAEILSKDANVVAVSDQCQRSRPFRS